LKKVIVYSVISGQRWKRCTF